MLEDDEEDEEEQESVWGGKKNEYYHGDNADYEVMIWILFAICPIMLHTPSHFFPFVFNIYIYIFLQQSLTASMETILFTN